MAASLVAVRCRLDVLGGQIAAEPTLGAFGAKLGHVLGRAAALARRGDDACAANDAGKARRRLKQVQTVLQHIAHRLGGLVARKRLDGSVRSSLIATISGLLTDVATLRQSPCP